eukprot:5143637-Amphidinium_carterae.1
MWRADPGPCVAPAVPWGDHPDDIEYERMLKAMPKKILLCRELIMKDSQLEKVCKRLGKIDFSVVVWKLSEYSQSSGFGEAAASYVKVLNRKKRTRGLHEHACTRKCTQTQRQATSKHLRTAHRMKRHSTDIGAD